MRNARLSYVAPLVVAFCAPAQADDSAWSLRGSTDVDTLPGTARSIADARPSQPIAPTGPVDAETEAQRKTEIFVPSITQSILFDDNLYATSKNKVSDFAYIIRPELNYAKSGSNYGLQANVYAEHRKYFKHSREDQTNAGAALGGTFQFNEDSQVQLRGSYARGHEERGAGEGAFLRVDRPTAFNQFDGGVALNNRFGKMWTSFGLAGLLVKYEDAKIQGQSFDQSYRDGAITVANGRVGYVVAPLTSAFVEVAVNRRDFKESDFNSDGYRLVGGLLFEPGPGARMKGEVWAGWMEQDFKNSRLETVSGLTYGGSLAFLVTDNVTFTAEGRREAKESGLAGGVSLVESYAGARVDVQIARNLYLGGGVTYLHDAYKGVGRKDHYWGPMASAKYVLNRYLTLGVEYRGVSFGTDDPFALKFKRNVALASATARF